MSCVEMHRLGMWKGDAISVELPLAEMAGVGADGCAVLIQQETAGLPGPILGAASYSLRTW